MKRSLLLLLVVLLTVMASAYDAYIDGIYYYFSGDEASVTNGNSSYSYLGAVVIPELVTYKGKTYSVTRIGDGAFQYCSRLTSVIIPNSVTRIRTSAFYNCTGLTSVTIGNSVTWIDNDAFSECSSLTSVHITDLAAWCNIAFMGGDSNPLYYAHHLYLNGLEINNLVIPEVVTSIGNNAFFGCTGLTSVTIPNSVTRIGDYAFRGCSRLTSVIIPNSVTRIGTSAFSGCSRLTSVIIPNSVTSIGSSAFMNCSGLTSVTIGSGVTNIQDEAFGSCTNLKKIIWLTNTPPSGYSYVKSSINYVSNEQYVKLSNTIVYPFLSSMFEVNGICYVPVNPSERTCDAIDCRHNETVANMNIASTVSYKGITMQVKKMQPYFCYNNQYIQTLYCDYEGIVSDYAFSGCTNLSSLTLGEKVSSIGDYSFQGCSSLSSVSIPNSVSTLGNYAFSSCI